MHFAICVWGLLRSLHFTFPSFQKFVLEPLESNYITYDILIHTYRYRNGYSNPRANEFNVSLNESTYFLLNPQYIYIEDHEEFNQQINYELFEAMGDPFGNKYSSLHFYIAGLHSLYHVTKVVENLILNNQEHYDGIIFVRPDVEFLNPLPIELLPPQRSPSNSKDVVINYRSILEELMRNSSIAERDPRKINPSVEHSRCPLRTYKSLPRRDWCSTNPNDPALYDLLYLPDFHRVSKVYNDRMAMATVSHGLLYGKRFEVTYNYSLYSLLHSEAFLKDYLDNMCNVTAIEIPFRFRRVRSNGKYGGRDISLLSPNTKKYSESPCLHPFQIAYEDFLAYQQRFQSFYQKDFIAQRDIKKVRKSNVITCSYEKIVQKVDRKHHLQRVKINTELGPKNKHRYFYLSTFIPPNSENIRVNESTPEEKFQISYLTPFQCKKSF